MLKRGRNGSDSAASEGRSRNVEGRGDTGITRERRSVKSERREGSLGLRKGSGLRRKKRRHSCEAFAFRRDRERRREKRREEREREREREAWKTDRKREIMLS